MEVISIKRSFTNLILIGFICSLLIGCNNKDNQLYKKPLSKLNSEDISSFIVTLRPPNEEYTITDTKTIADLINLLQDITIIEEDNSYVDYSGQWVEYKLSMTDGSCKTIASFNPFIIIDGVGYKTEYEPCEKLNVFGNKFSKRRQ